MSINHSKCLLYKINRKKQKQKLPIVYDFNCINQQRQHEKKITKI